MKKTLLRILVLLMLLVLPFEAFAGDTTEPLDMGTLEVDPVFAVEGIGDGKPGVSTEVAVNYGVLDGFTIGVTLGYGSEEGLAGGNLSAALGLLWNPVDTDHFDFDVMLDFEYGLADGYSLKPGVELNYDLEPDQGLWGLYLVLGLPVSGGRVLDDARADVGLELKLGTYFTIAEDHQIILEGGMNVENLAKKLGDRGIADPFVSVGYNVVLTDTFELTTEVALAIPNGDDGFSATLAIGGIFGMLNKNE